MTVEQALKQGRALLKESNIDNYSAEALWLLENRLGINSAGILAKGGAQITPEQEADYDNDLRLRISGVPVQYITGKWDFYGRSFFVGEGVLIPRPETEILAEESLRLIKEKASPVVIDLCAGTGCIGLTVSLERPDARVYLVEKYDPALSFLRKNAEGIPNAEIIKGDVLDTAFLKALPLADLIISNPPYIKTGEIPALQREVSFEPETALDGGEDGLEFYRAIAGAGVECPVIVECGEDQGESVKAIFGGGYILRDYSGLDRIVIRKGDLK